MKRCFVSTKIIHHMVNAAVLAMLFFAPQYALHPAKADFVYWTGGDGSWSDHTKWNPGVPVPGANVDLTSISPGTTIHYDYNYTDPLNSLIIGQTDPGVTLYMPTDNTLKSVTEMIGYLRQGHFIQENGTNEVEKTLSIGRKKDSKGTYTLKGGELYALREYIGYKGEGDFTQDGGTNGVGKLLSLGRKRKGDGQYTLNDGKLHARKEFIGKGGEGHFIQDGGTNTVTETLNIGPNGQYTQSGGTLEAGKISNNNKLTQKLGSVNVIGDVINTGQIKVNKTAASTKFNKALNNTGTIINNGTIDNSLGTFNNSGRYQGTGTFIGNLDTGSGTVAPGNSPGSMCVMGDYSLGGTGILEIEVGGFSPGEYDFLDITGTAFLTGGTIDLMFLGGYDISTDVGNSQTHSLMFLEADLGIDSSNSLVTYDFLGTPDGFLYDVYQDGIGLVNWLRRRKAI